MATIPANPFRRRPLRSALRSRLYAFALLAPAVAAVLLVITYPLLMAGQMSLYDVRVFLINRGFTGEPSLRNYQDMFANPAFWLSLRVTLAYVALGTIGSFLVGLGTALLLNQPFRGRFLARILVVLPWPIPGVVAATTFMWMFNASFGVINYLLIQLGIVTRPISWFTESTPALIAVTVATVWKGYPFFTITLLAGMQSIPRDLYEAARVDGASALKQFWYITVPALRSVMGIAMVISTLWLFRVFDIIYVMTGGGPSRSTETLAIQIYREAFQYFEMGYASAVGMVALALSIVATLIYLRVSSRSFY